MTTDEEELEKAQSLKNISASWAGGQTGSKIIFDFIADIDKNLHDLSIVYLLLSSENEYNKIINYIIENTKLKKFEVNNLNKF